MPLQGRRAAVFGLGRSGLASARFLRARGASATAFDQGPAVGFTEALRELSDLGIAALTGVRDWRELGDPDLLVVSPGVPVSHPILAAAREAGAEVIGEIELAWRFCAAPMVAVAGTNGKGSTATLLGGMLRAAGLRAAVAGNIGTPLVSVVAGDWQVVVAEVSSFQLETIVGFRPWAAILLNITPDHLDRHGDFAGYLAAKQRLFMNQQPTDLAILNLDDPVVASLAGSTAAQVLGVSAATPGGAGYVEADRLMVRLPGQAPVLVCERQDLRLGGPHYVIDALCAGVAAAAAGCDTTSLQAAVRSWQPAGHLLAEVAVVNGVRFIDDSKATNPGAAMADLDSLSGPFWVIAGGLAKGLDLGAFADKLAATARGAFLIGEAAESLAAGIAGRIPATLCPDIQTAVRAASAAANPGETVILAPACASFDQFQGQADRGEKFVAAVRALA
jgi:UDP-N-acetylmuramoylalanine--D-glutamate ligase